MGQIDLISRAVSVALVMSYVEWQTLEVIQEATMRNYGLGASETERILRRMQSAGDVIGRQEGLRFEYRLVSQQEREAMDALEQDCEV